MDGEFRPTYVALSIYKVLYLISIDWINIYILKNLQYDMTDCDFILRLQIQSAEIRYPSWKDIMVQTA